MATLMYYLGADTYTYNLVAIDYKVDIIVASITSVVLFTLMI